MADDDDGVAAKRSFWHWLQGALGSPWILALLGAAFGAYFQARNWSYQNSVAQIKADTQNVLDTGPKLTALINARYAAAVQMSKASGDGVADDASKAARQQLASARKEWDFGFTDLMSQLKFYVDAPFAVKDENRLKQAAELDCTRYTLPMLPQKLDAGHPLPAALLLGVLNHCFAEIEDNLERVKPAKNPADAKARDETIRAESLRLGHVWRVNTVLRCVVDGRALQIRGAQSRPMSLGTLFLGYDSPTSYDVPPAEADCLRDYREDAVLGEGAAARE